MREFIGSPIIKSKLEQLTKIRDCAITFCQYIEYGGGSCDFTDRLIDSVIDEAMKLKASRDYIYKYCGYDIPIYDDEGIRLTD